MHEDLTRREIIKTILVTTATSLIGGKVWAAKTVSEVTANAIDPNVGVARIQLSRFPALANDGGSVRLGSSGIDANNLPIGLYYPIIINRVSQSQYVVIESQCLHEGTIIGAFVGSVATGRMTCPKHSSQYEIHGVCTRNPSVAAGYVGKSLRTFPATIEGDMLVVQIGDQGFNIRQTTVLNGTEERLAISFDSFSFVEYELRFRPDTATEPVQVSFSKTPSGSMSSAITTGNDTAADDPGAMKMYVLPQNGIYQVAIRLRSV